jgi:hypothetical protein
MDLDQGGTFQEWTNVYLGPSIGWQRKPALNTLTITTGGTFTLDLAISYVAVNTTGAVTLNLPPASNPASGAGAQPGPFVDNSIIIADVGGNATLHPITIQAASGDTVLGLASTQITTNYGALNLQPNSTTRTWNSI